MYQAPACDLSDPPGCPKINARMIRFFHCVCQNVKPLSAPPSGRASSLMLVLASTSLYRRELLARLAAAFERLLPGVDETPWPDEPPDRHGAAAGAGQSKGRAPASYPTALCDRLGPGRGARRIASTSPGAASAPQQQLQLRQRPRSRVPHRGVRCSSDHRSHAGEAGSDASSVPRADVVGRSRAYLDREQPYDCAGSAKSEGLGIALLEQIQGDDPTALIGLPLIAVCIPAARRRVERALIVAAQTAGADLLRRTACCSGAIDAWRGEPGERAARSCARDRARPRRLRRGEAKTRARS